MVELSCSPTCTHCVNETTMGGLFELHVELITCLEMARRCASPDG